MRTAIIASSSWFTTRSVGGAEKQIYYISTALAAAGHHVDLFTMDIDAPFISEGVNVFPAWDRSKGIRKIRYITHRIPELKKKIVAGNYDLVYMRGRSIFSSAVIKALHHSKTISVIGIAADSNLSWQIWKQSFPIRNKWNDFFKWLLLKYFHVFALRSTNVIAVQNDNQAINANSFSKDIVYCPNIFQQTSQANSSQHVTNSDIVWIGGLRLEKGVESLFAIIDSLPKIQFTVIGETTGSRQAFFSKEFTQRPNVNYINHVDNSEIHGILKSSKLLLNTSPHEGFSNTFLEAWYSEIPVISLHVNPSNLLTDFKLGYYANGNMDLLIDNILYLLENDSLRASIGKNAKSYVLEEHSADKVVKLFENITLSTLK